MLRCVWGIVALFLIACASEACAQAPQLAISGYVRDELTQEPISAARVALRTISGEQIGQATMSANDGGFHLSAATGNYVVVVEHSGYQLTSFLLGSSPSTVMVSLRRLHADVHGGATAVSTHELSVPIGAREAFEKAAAMLSKNPPDYERAIREFRRAIKEFPGYYEAYGEMSIAQFRSGDSRSAEASLRKSITLSMGHYAGGMALLAELLNSQHRFGEAESMARQAIAVDELSVRAHCQLARALSGLNRPAEAIISAKRALELEPANPVTSLVLGNIHVQQHDFASAVHDFDLYLQEHPTGPQSDLVRVARNRAQDLLNLNRKHSQVSGP